MRLSAAERKELLALYADLRVADVRDGMDWLMRHGQGSMIPQIRPLWRTRVVGFAKTVRYFPYRGEVPKMTPEEYTAWSGWYYREVCPYPWIETIEEGDVCVIDQSGIDAGLMGSNNTMDGVIKGARGYVTNGGVRDTDEIIRQKIPFFGRPFALSPWSRDDCSSMLTTFQSQSAASWFILVTLWWPMVMA